jgi:hypothetical protein
MTTRGTTPETPAAIRFAITQMDKQQWHALPATVVSYDPATQQIRAQPSVRVIVPVNGQDVPQALPIVGGVPVIFPGGAGYSITWPLLPGNDVLLIVSTVAIDAWLGLGSPDTIPQNRRRNSLSDCFAIPEIRPTARPRASASGTNMRLGLDTGVTEIEITPTEVLLGSRVASDFVALASLVLAELGAIVSDFNSHTHLETGATTDPPLPQMIAPSSVAAGKVKAV